MTSSDGCPSKSSFAMVMHGQSTEHQLGTIRQGITDPRVWCPKKHPDGGILVHPQPQANQKKTDDRSLACVTAKCHRNPTDGRLQHSNIYDADRLARSGGWIRPLAIRATSGHSFSGDHKHPWSVNIDYDRMNMTLTSRGLPCHQDRESTIDCIKRAFARRRSCQRAAFRRIDMGGPGGGVW